MQGIAGDLLTNSVKVTVGNGGDRLTASTSVTQRVHVVPSGSTGRMEKFKVRECIEFYFESYCK